MRRLPRCGARHMPPYKSEDGTTERLLTTAIGREAPPGVLDRPPPGVGPYRGAGAALPDLLGGQVQVMFGTMPSSIEYIRTGKVRALAVTTAMRSGTLPDLPTVADFVPGYEASSWYGIGAPKGTPSEIIDRLNKTINAGLTDPKVKARLADLGGTMLAISPADFGKLIADETEKWAKVVRFVGLKAD
jgi:tripartite-type tricarboxylate transporter receptor subunit TctC